MIIVTNFEIKNKECFKWHLKTCIYGVRSDNMILPKLRHTNCRNYRDDIILTFLFVAGIITGSSVFCTCAISICNIHGATNWYSSVPAACCERIIAEWAGYGRENIQVFYRALLPNYILILPYYHFVGSVVIRDDAQSIKRCLGQYSP